MTETKTAEQLIAEAKFKVDSFHHIHGTECLCGFKSDRSRSRTEHITKAMREELTRGFAGLRTHEEPSDEQLERVAKAIFMTDYAHMGEEAWETARLDGNSDRRDAFEKARAAIEEMGDLEPVDEEELEEVIYSTIPYNVESSAFNEPAEYRYITNRCAKDFAEKIAKAVAAWLKGGNR